MLTNHYWHFPQALTTMELNYLRDVAHQGLQQAQQGVHMGDNADKRRSDVAWTTDTRTLQIATSLIYEANRNAGWWFDINYPEQAQLTHYGIDGEYDWHKDGNQDHFAARQYVNGPLRPMPLNKTNALELVGQVRKLSLSINLSEEDSYQGGALELQIGEATHIITGSAGSATVFPSWTMHRITPITEGSRQSLVLWMNGPPIR
tara:strand:+ start:988 stop:1599 length:612 start_codon:yes stop_codon:yes gene_type:complete